MTLDQERMEIDRNLERLRSVTELSHKTLLPLSTTLRLLELRLKRPNFLEALDLELAQEKLTLTESAHYLEIFLGLPVEREQMKRILRHLVPTFRQREQFERTSRQAERESRRSKPSE